MMVKDGPVHRESTGEPLVGPFGHPFAAPKNNKIPQKGERQRRRESENDTHKEEERDRDRERSTERERQRERA